MTVVIATNTKITQLDIQILHLSIIENRYMEIFDKNIDDLVKVLKDHGQIPEPEFNNMINHSILYNSTQHLILGMLPNIMKTESPTTVVGDIHGQFYDLLGIFAKEGYPPQNKYIFLGDYVDRGNFSIEVITLLFYLQLKYPKQVILLRGNHQSKLITSSHNFRLQCSKKYSSQTYEIVINLFQALPICCILDHKYFCVHGGISPTLTSLKQLQTIDRFVQVPEKGLLCDLLWSDPTEKQLKEWAPNNVRSCSYFYSNKQASQFLDAINFKMIIRGHQVQISGYKYLEGPNAKCALTIFSAPNYCKRYKNEGAVANISSKGISVRTYKCQLQPYCIPGYKNLFQWTIPFIAKSTSHLFVKLMSKKLNFPIKNVNRQGLQQLKDHLKSPEMKVLCDMIQNYQEKFTEILQINQDQQDLPDDSSNEIEKNIIRVLYFMVAKKNDRNNQSWVKCSCDFSEQISEGIMMKVFGPKIKEFPKIHFRRQN